jgi:hypothetical protein
MKTLKDLKDNIERLLIEHPEYANLPLIYSSDDEGNSFHLVHSSLCLAQVEDIKEYYLELVGFDGDEDINSEDINCICIN